MATLTAVGTGSWKNKATSHKAKQNDPTTNIVKSILANKIKLSQQQIKIEEINRIGCQPR